MKRKNSGNYMGPLCREGCVSIDFIRAIREWVV